MRLTSLFDLLSIPFRQFPAGFVPVRRLVGLTHEKINDLVGLTTFGGDLRGNRRGVGIRFIWLSGCISSELRGVCRAVGQLPCDC